MNFMSEFPFDPLDMAPLLLAWYGRKGRDLPWRRNRDPYRIWLSEIMLQQTTVQAVIPYYHKFLADFPSVEALACAPVERVIELWAGLGYYSRARNLHTAAIRVVEDFDGRFPSTLDELKTLPGVGRSTAGAILSIAFDRKAPILDGNVRRVLCRLFALQEPPRSASAEKRLWFWAEALTSEERPHDYAQAIMDLGATVCTPKRPDCDCCPLESLCQARRQGLEQALPLKGQRKEIPTKKQVALVIECHGAFLVRRRPLSGMLSGLWEFPSRLLSAEQAPGQVASELLKEGGETTPLTEVGRVSHAYSHFRVEITVMYATVDAVGLVSESEDRWLTLAELSLLALHGAHKKIVPLLASP